MRRFVWIAFVGLVGVFAGLLVPTAGAAPPGVIRSSSPMSAAVWDCVADLHAQGVALDQALTRCSPALEGPDGQPVGTGIGSPYGGVLGRAETPSERQIDDACGYADSGVAEGEGRELTKAERDVVILLAWKDYLAAREKGDTLAAEAAYARWQQLHNTNHGTQRTDPLAADQCERLQEAARAMDRAIRTCEAKGWQSSAGCRSLAAQLFGCVDPTVSLTTGDYRCGGKPSDASLRAAQEHAYLICSALQRGGNGADPCRQADYGKDVLQALVFERDKCNDPTAHWESCGEPVDVETALQGLTPGGHPVLAEICAKLGGPSCLMPDQDGGSLPPKGPGGPK